MTYGLGYRPDSPRIKARNAVVGSRSLRARLGVGVAASRPVDLSRFAPYVMDQAQTGSCTGHAIASAAYLATRADKGPLGLPFVPSPKGIYTLERCLERSGASTPLTDSGAMISDGMLVLSSWGVSPMKQLPDRYSDVDPESVNDEPDFLGLEQDARTLLVGAHPITSTGDQLAEDVMTALSAAFPVVLGVPGGSDAWQNYTSGVLDSIAAPLDHCVYILGGDGDTFTIRNSWGAGWGEQGNVRVSRRFLEVSTGDRYALSVRMA